jgi:hypothetical protein
MRYRRLVADQVLHVGPGIDDPDRALAPLPRDADVQLAPVFSDGHRPTPLSGHARPT